MAIKIQRIVRGRLARVRCFWLLRNMAATRIQCLWRGVVGRLFTDKLWLQKTVIPIQNMYRRRLALKRYVGIKAEFNAAALKIQKKFRNWYSSRRMGDRLFEREMGYRMKNIKMLTSEEELCQEYLSKAMERLVKNQFKEKAEKATKALINCEVDIYTKENDLTEFRRQSEILSSRAREQGFDVELAKNIADTRNELTELKLKYIFELSADVHRADGFLEDQVYEVESWAANRNRVSEWRSDQYDERRHLNYKREILARRRAKRIAIGEERRRWAVLYYTSDGKPDKRRRPGRPWEASVFAGGEKAVYSGGNGVNLMAHIQKEKLARAGGSEFKMGSIKSVEQTLQQVSLQTYLEEVNLYEQLLNPIQQIMEKNMGLNPMGLSAMAQNGWGPEGAKVVPALQDIGAIPAPGEVRKQSLRQVSGSVKKSPSSSRASSPSGKTRSTRSVRSQSQVALHDMHSSRDSSLPGSAPTAASQRQVTWKPDLFSASADNSERLGFEGDDVKAKADAVSAISTPMDVLRVVKARKKAARKSLLPALDAHTYLYDHQRPPEQTAYIGDLKTLDRLYEKQAQAAETGRVNAGRRASAHTSAMGTTPSATATSAEVNRSRELMPVRSTATVASASTKSVQQSSRSQQLMPLGVSLSHLIGTERAERPSAGTRPTASSVEEVVKEEMYWNDVHKAAREEEESARRAIYEKRRSHKKAQVRSSKIPWELMDSLDGQKTRFENEKLYHEFNHKY
eukprot:gene9224-10880_t